MIRFWKKLGMAGALATAAMAMGGAAQARDSWNGGGNDDAIIAIGAGLVGLAIGAALADRDDDRYYDRRYYDSRRYVTVRDRPGYYYYYEGNPNRYYRDRYYTRYYQPYYRQRNQHYYSRDRYRDNRPRYYQSRNHIEKRWKQPSRERARDWNHRRDRGERGRR